MEIFSILNENTVLRKLLHQPRVEFTKSKIEIKSLHWNKLNKRLKELYKEKNMFSLFEIKYRSKDLALYNKKKIPKSKMKIEYIRTDYFFALEAMIMFENLYKTYGFKYYNDIAQQIYEGTWLSKKRPLTTKVDINKLKNIKYTLKTYQIEFIKEYPKFKDTYGLEGYLLSFDQGLGKTLTSIALSECLNKDLTIITCPNSLKGNWLHEIKSYFGKYEDDEIFRNEVYAIGESKWQCNKDKLKYLIVNHEAIPSSHSYIRLKSDKMFIVDESHFFRNMDGKRANEMIELKRKFEIKDNILMSGTPIKALPNEMCPVMMMIDPMFTDDVALKYKQMFNVDGLNTSDMVKRRFDMIMHRRTKSQVLALPEKNYHNYEVTLQDGQKYNIGNVKKDIMTEFLKQMELEQPNYDTYETEYIRLIKLYCPDSHELSKYITYLKNLKNGKSSQYHELELEAFESFSKVWIYPYIKSPAELKEFKRAETLYLRLKESCMGRAIGKILPKYRTEMYIEMWKANRSKFIDMIESNEKKTVIFSSLLNVVKYISEDLFNDGIDNVMIIGETKNRTEEVQRFKEEDICDVLVASCQTLSTGFTLVEADQMFFFGTPWRDADFEQCCDRIYRIGQTTDVNIYTVLLSTGARNLSTRMDDILNWSNDMFTGFIDTNNI